MKDHNSLTLPLWKWIAAIEQMEIELSCIPEHPERDRAIGNLVLIRDRTHYPTYMVGEPRGPRYRQMLWYGKLGDYIDKEEAMAYNCNLRFEPVQHIQRLTWALKNANSAGLATRHLEP